MEVFMAESIPYEKGLTFEKVWAMFQETDKKFQETDKKFQKDMEQMRENLEQSRKEADREMRETREQMRESWEQSRKEAEQRRKAIDQQIDRVSKQMGDLHNSFGKLAEHLVAPGIAKRFNKLGFHFDDISPGGIRILDETGTNILTEIDLLLNNMEHVIALEVKSTPAEKDIAHHLKRLEILRWYMDKKKDKRKILGGIAGAIFPAKVKALTIEAGLYVLEQSGDTMKIEIPEGFKPREW
jgi:hypothetical protein